MCRPLHESLTLIASRRIAFDLCSSSARIPPVSFSSFCSFPPVVYHKASYVAGPFVSA